MPFTLSSSPPQSPGERTEQPGTLYRDPAVANGYLGYYAVDADGQAIRITIRADLVDDVIWRQIQELVRLLTIRSRLRLIG